MKIDKNQNELEYKEMLARVEKARDHHRWAIFGLFTLLLVILISLAIFIVKRGQTSTVGLVSVVAAVSGFALLTISLIRKIYSEKRQSELMAAVLQEATVEELVAEVEKLMRDDH